MSYPVQPGYPVVPVQPGYAVVSDQNVNTVEVVVAWVFTVFTLGYFLPWAIAATRGKRDSWAVGLVNFLLGWTFVGWIGALVWGCTAHGLRPAPAAYAAVAPSQQGYAQQAFPQAVQPQSWTSERVAPQALPAGDPFGVAGQGQPSSPEPYQPYQGHNPYAS